MYKIVKAKELTTNIYLMEVEAKRVAHACEPGQFVIVRMDEDGESENPRMFMRNLPTVLPLTNRDRLCIL